MRTGVYITMPWSARTVKTIAPLVKEMNTVLHGKGGGRNGFAQGSVEARQEETEAFFRKG